MSHPPIPRFSDQQVMTRRQLLSIGTVGLVAGCIGRFEDDTPPPVVDDRFERGPDEYDAGPSDDAQRESHDDRGAFDDDDDDDNEDSHEEGPGSDLTFEGFTHFPTDFAALFADFEARDLLASPPITPFYFHAHPHTEGPRKWYLTDHQTPPHERVYLPADGAVTEWTMSKVDTLATVHGERVHVDADVEFYLSDSVRVFYQHLGLRDEIVRSVRESDEEFVILEAGTHIGYMYFPPWNSFDFGVHDVSSTDRLSRNPDHWLNSRVNPLDYFVNEKREELLELYQPLYERMEQEGVYAWSDLTDSRRNTHVSGTLEGLWFRNELSDHELWPPETHWGMLNFVGSQHLHGETYWRVLEHPWNVAHNFAGLFTESAWGSPPKRPLYDSEPIGEFGARLYVLEGDLTGGVAMIIDGQWDPREPEDENDNHPSRGARRYLVFDVDRANDKFDEHLTIQGFMTERGAMDGFTEGAITYRRDPER